VCGLFPVASRAAFEWRAGATGNWHTVANWSEDWSAEPVVHQLPTASDRTDIGAGGVILITWDVTVDTVWSYAVANAVTQSGGAVSSPSGIRISNPKSAPHPAWTIRGGSLSANRLSLAWNNSTNAIGHMVQDGGSVDVDGDIYFCVKSETQIGYYDLVSGVMTASVMRLGVGGTNQQAVFTQSGGTATIDDQVFLGQMAGAGDDPDAKAVINLDGGSLTIAGTTPFEFAQPGAPVYVDIDGGTLILKGTWDFATLSAITGSDFRSAGVPATAGNLMFTPVSIDGNDFTAVTLRPPPPSLILLIW